MGTTARLATLRRPQEILELQRAAGNQAVRRVLDAGGGAPPVQRVNAYRVEADPLNPKIQVDGAGTFASLLDDGYGVGISFVNEDHAMYYLATKGPEAQYITIDFDDGLWEVIKTRKKSRNTGNATYDRLPTPVECTDPKVPNKENAIHFQQAWLPHLEGAIKSVTVTQPGWDTSELEDTDVVWAYIDDPADGWQESLGDARRYGYQHMSTLEASFRGYDSPY